MLQIYNTTKNNNILLKIENLVFLVNTHLHFSY